MKAWARLGLVTCVAMLLLWAGVRDVGGQTGQRLISCFVNASTATTLTAMGGSCAAPGAGVSIYLTDILFGSSAAGGTAADASPTLKYGTGGSCGTGTTSFWAAATVANGQVTANFSTPIKIARNNEVCFIMSTVGTKWIVLNGFIDK